MPFAGVAVDAVCREMMEVAFQSFGRIDILVNNAGTTRFISHPDLEAVKAMVERARAELGPIGVLVSGYCSLTRTSCAL